MKKESVKAPKRGCVPVVPTPDEENAYALRLEAWQKFQGALTGPAPEPTEALRSLILEHDKVAKKEC